MAWRVADSKSLDGFLGYKMTEGCLREQEPDEKAEGLGTAQKAGRDY